MHSICTLSFAKILLYFMITRVCYKMPSPV